MLGPGPPPKRSNKERDKGRLTEKRDPESGEVGSSTGTGTSSETIGGNEAAQEGRHSGDDWNRRRYQREDEILWGFDEEDARSSMGLSPISRSTSGHGRYYYARNPAVNDLHPPVVSTQPQSKAETRWMLQPPPKAKVMEGKEKANRSRSGSGGSHGSRGSSKKAVDTGLGRQVGERILETKLKQSGGTSVPSSSAAVSKQPSHQSAASSSNPKPTPQGQGHDRDMNFLTKTYSEPLQRSESFQRKRPPPPITLPSNPSLSSPPPPRPPLSTIPSTSLIDGKANNKPSHLRPLLLSTNSVSSLHILQELIPPNSQLNSVHSKSPNMLEAVGVKLPPVSMNEDQELRLPEVESWFPESRWEFPAELNSDVRTTHRWSMDI